MELHIQSEFDCVYTVNGEFFERADTVEMNEYDVAYITVFPLDHALLPYTVKLNGGTDIKSELAVGIRLSSEHYLLTLAPRRPMIYGSAVTPPPDPADMIARCFARIRSGDVAAAYAMLSPQLKAAVDKQTLADFFKDCERLAVCKWSNDSKFYMIDKNNNAKLCSYTVKDGFIDDIAEE